MNFKFWVSIKYKEGRHTHSVTIYNVVNVNVSGNGIILFLEDGTFKRYSGVIEYKAQLQKEGEK